MIFTNNEIWRCTIWLGFYRHLILVLEIESRVGFGLNFVHSTTNQIMCSTAVVICE